MTDGERAVKLAQAVKLVEEVRATFNGVQTKCSECGTQHPVNKAEYAQFQELDRDARYLKVMLGYYKTATRRRPAAEGAE